MFVPAIIFVNGNTDGYGYDYGDLEPITKSTLSTQLYIHEIITGDEFDNRISVDPNYATLVHLMQYRILVIKHDLMPGTNYNLADVIIYVKHGLAAIEKNNYGPHGLTIPISNIEIHKLLRYNNSPYVAILPEKVSYPFPPTLGGIFAIQSRDTSGVHTANTDNEQNNEDFINRK